MKAVVLAEGDTLTVCAQALADNGDRVISCGDDQSLISLVGWHFPDLVLVDLDLLTTMIGGELIGKVQSSPAGAYAQIMLISAAPEIAHDVRLANVACHMVKPVDVETVAGHIRAVADAGRC